MTRWSRPYGSTDEHVARNVFTAGMSVFGLIPICGFALGELSAAGAAAVVLFVVVWETGLWRIALVGIYVSDHGIKIRHVVRTRVIPWARVTGAWAGRAADYDAWQIWVSTRDPDEDLATPLWRRGSRKRHGNRVVLPPDEFAATLAALDPRS